MANSQAVPEDRIRIFSRSGNPLAEFSAGVDRSYSIGQEGRAQFIYPYRKRDVVNKDVLRFGNWLLIQNEALPTWIGVIDTPRQWSSRTVIVNAYSPERVFSWRRGSLETLVTGSAGTIFEKLLSLINNAENTILRPGNIWKGGAKMEETINPNLLSEELQRIQERSKEEYSWRTVIDGNGKLTVYADWSKRIGSETGELLQEGKRGGNVEALENMLVEDGPIINDLQGFGEGDSWKTKKSFIARNQASINLYGLRQSAEEFYGVSAIGTITNNTKALLAEMQDTKRAFHLNALNVGSTFKYIRLGNKLRLRFENVGFDTGGAHFQTMIRIMAMSFDNQMPNKIELVVEEVL